MSETIAAVKACSYGCTIRGRHRTDCRDVCKHQRELRSCPERDRCEGKCSGCLPRPAEDGAVLCGWCIKVLTNALAEVPAIAEHLRWMGKPDEQPLAKPLSDDTINRPDPAEGTVLTAPWLALDELQSLLASWALLIMEEHPNQPMRGPNASPWHGDVVAWMTPLLPWCVQQEDWAADMRSEIPKELAVIHARWPTIEDSEDAKRVTMPCPACDMFTLTYIPPRFAHQPFVVSCDNPDCAAIYGEDQFDWFKHMHLSGAGSESVEDLLA